MDRAELLDRERGEVKDRDGMLRHYFYSCN